MAARTRGSKPPNLSNYQSVATHPASNGQKTNRDRFWTGSIIHRQRPLGLSPVIAVGANAWHRLVLCWPEWERFHYFAILLSLGMRAMGLWPVVLSYHRTVSTIRRCYSYLLTTAYEAFEHKYRLFLGGRIRVVAGHSNTVIHMLVSKGSPWCIDPEELWPWLCCYLFAWVACLYSQGRKFLVNNADG